MTHRQLISTLTAALVALALLAAAAGAGAATQTDDPGIRITDGTATSGGNTSVDVVLTSAPNGLGGYYLDLTVESPDSARLVTVSYPDRFGLTTTPAYSDNGTTVTLEAADLNGAVESGATDVRLATVEIAGAGDVSLAVEPRQFDDDDGNAFQPAQVSPETTTPTTDPAETPSEDRGTANASATATGSSGPLSPALAVGAVALLTGLGLRRYEP